MKISAGHKQLIVIILLSTSATLLCYRVINAALPNALDLTGSGALGLFFGVFFGWLVRSRAE